MELDAESKLLRAETAISMLLRLGVIICGLVIAFGWGWMELSERHGGVSQLAQISDARQLQERPTPTTIKNLCQQIQALQPQAIISLGLLLLISLPILRVALSGVIFFLQRDFIFVLLSGTVLIILTVGLVLGKSL